MAWQSPAGPVDRQRFRGDGSTARTRRRSAGTASFVCELPLRAPLSLGRRLAPKLAAARQTYTLRRLWLVRHSVWFTGKGHPSAAAARAAGPLSRRARATWVLGCGDATVWPATIPRQRVRALCPHDDRQRSPGCPLHSRPFRIGPRGPTGRIGLLTGRGRRPRRSPPQTSPPGPPAWRRRAVARRRAGRAFPPGPPPG